MKQFTRLAMAAIASMGLSCMAQATVFVPDYGSTGSQVFTYTFANDFSGVITIGVSDTGDDVEASTLKIPGRVLTTDPTTPVDTSAYLNTLGEAGTDGEVYSVDWDAEAGDIFTFSWKFSTEDYHPFHDFAFIDIEGLHYEVLAQIDGPLVSEVPVPAAAWLFGSGLLGLAGVARRRV